MATEYVAIVFTILFTIGSSGWLGGYMFRVFAGRDTWLDPVLVPIERLVLWSTGVDASQAQDWNGVTYQVERLVASALRP